jgi:predicted XRE-type DNA-binding protein
VRADLMIRLEKELGSRGLKQAQAAKLLEITQPRVSDLLRGRVELFSADALIDMLARLGIKVRVVASSARGSRRPLPTPIDRRHLGRQWIGMILATEAVLSKGVFVLDGPLERSPRRSAAYRPSASISQSL